MERHTLVGIDKYPDFPHLPIFPIVLLSIAIGSMLRLIDLAVHMCGCTVVCTGRCERVQRQSGKSQAEAVCRGGLR